MKSLFYIFKESTQSFEGQERDEGVVLLLRKHPFVIILPLSLLGLAGILPILVIFVFHAYVTDHSLFLTFLFLSSIYYIMLWVASFYILTMYTLNTIIITDKRIIDNDQRAFFNRQVSELHVYRIQDVTVYTRGVIETFLHFGDVVVQTAASEKQFIFHQIPRPEEVKDIIMKVASARHAGVKIPAQ